MPLPDVAEQEIETDVLCAVAPGEAAMVVTAYERAAGLAEALWDALDRAGLGREVIAVVPSLTADLRPVARLELTPEGARRVGWLFARQADPSLVERGDGTNVA